MLPDTEYLVGLCSQIAEATRFPAAQRKPVKVEVGLHALEIGFTDEFGSVQAVVEGRKFELPRQGAQGAQCALYALFVLYSANAATYCNAARAADEDAAQVELALHAIAASAFAPA